MKPKHLSWLWMVPVLLVVTGLASRRLLIDIFWLDEEFSIFMSTGAHFGPLSPLDIIIQTGDHAWPPLHNFALVGWSWLFGWSEFATRSLSLYLGVMGVAVIYRLGHDLFDDATGLIAGMVATSSAFLIHYMHEGRGYTLYVFLTVLCVWSYWRLLNGPSGYRARWMRRVFLLSLVGLLYTHYIAATTPLALGLYHLLFVKRDRRWGEIFQRFFVAGLLFVPWALIAVLAVLAESNVKRGLGTIKVITASFDAYSNGLWIYLVVVLGIVAWRVQGRAAGLVGFWLGIAFISALIFNLFTDFLFHVRHIIVILPPLVLLIARAIREIRQINRIAGFVALAGWMALGMAGYVSPNFMNSLPGQEPTLPREPMMAAFDTLARCAGDDDAAVFNVSERADEELNNRVLRYYLYGQPLRYGQVGTLGDLSAEEKPELNGSYADRFYDLTDSARLVWYFAFEAQQMHEDTAQFTELAGENLNRCASLDLPGDMVGEVYTSGPAEVCQHVLTGCGVNWHD